jgi:hypothetical protein
MRLEKGKMKKMSAYKYILFSMIAVFTLALPVEAVEIVTKKEGVFCNYYNDIVELISATRVRNEKLIQNVINRCPKVKAGTHGWTVNHPRNTELIKIILIEFEKEKSAYVWTFSGAYDFQKHDSDLPSSQKGEKKNGEPVSHTQ